VKESTEHKPPHKLIAKVVSVCLVHNQQAHPVAITNPVKYTPNLRSSEPRVARGVHKSYVESRGIGIMTSPMAPTDDNRDTVRLRVHEGSDCLVAVPSHSDFNPETSSRGCAHLKNDGPGKATKCAIARASGNCGLGTQCTQSLVRRTGSEIHCVIQPMLPYHTDAAPRKHAMIESRYCCRGPRWQRCESSYAWSPIADLTIREEIGNLKSRVAC
jgi:hypothetical protein